MVDRGLVFYTDEAWCHLSGYVNSQNNRYWSAENQHSVHKVPFHDVKIGVWCAISAHRIIGPVFFRELTEEEKTYGYFM
jgi:hypothetical protein